MKFRTLVILSIALTISSPSILHTEEKKPNVEVKLKNAEVTSSENWIELTFIITNNTKEPLRYVVVELAGWSKDEDGKRSDLMISNDYYSDPILANDHREVTFAVRYLKGANIWTVRVIEIGQ